MNEQLIAKIAYATLLRTGAPTGTREWQKIFTELIVKECANVGERYANGNYEVYNQILEHFGVEE